MTILYRTKTVRSVDFLRFLTSKSGSSSSVYVFACPEVTLCTYRVCIFSSVTCLPKKVEYIAQDFPTSVFLEELNFLSLHRIIVSCFIEVMSNTVQNTIRPFNKSIPYSYIPLYLLKNMLSHIYYFRFYCSEILHGYVLCDHKLHDVDTLW